MRRNARSIKTSPEVVRHIEGLTEANFKMLTRLTEWLVENDKVNRKFRNAVLIRLSRIEATVQAIHGLQIVMQRWSPGFEEKVQKQAEAAEEFIARSSDELGLKMAKYIYGKEPASEPRRDRRRSWWGWEI